jgi:hypothetical protein
MANEVREEGVSRSEFYGIVSLLFLSLFTVITILAFEPTHWLRMICNILLYVAFLGAGMWFAFLSARERKRRKSLKGGPDELPQVWRVNGGRLVGRIQPHPLADFRRLASE